MSDATTLDAGLAGDDPAQRVRAYLVVREGGRAQVIDLDDGAEVTFGRSAEATVRVDDSKASREHARFVRRRGAIELRDLGSRNGTRLNGETVRGATRTVRSGDLVQIGAAEIVVAESAGVAGGGARLDAELQRVLRGGGRAAILRLSLSTTELSKLSGALGSATLVERQANGDYACLLEDASAAAKLASAIAAVAPRALVATLHAPDDGTTAAALWQQHDANSVAAKSTSKSGSAKSGAAKLSAAKSLAAKSSASGAPAGLVVGDPAMAKVFQLARKVAAAPTTVLILGETGVGKEVVAEQVHRQSPRASGPFVRLNCGSLPETLLESELFGHEKGAFTGADRRKLGYVEAAHGGTLFLDEVGELSAAMQTRLLRVLEDRKFMRVGGREEISSDLRVLAATNRNLEDEVAAGRFRQDLFFRLSAFVIRIPPLRERTVELELLADLFARQLARRMNSAPPRITPAAMEILRRHRWPGNVRELRNAMEHALVVVEGGVLDVEDLPESVRAGAQAAPPALGGAMREQIAELERRNIEEALEAEGGNQTRAAKRLGISRRALQYKLEKIRKG